jgi:hypothetical protein
MKKSLLPIAVMAATLLYASCKSGEPVDLKLNLQPGSQYLYTMDMKMTMQQSAMGNTVKTEQDMMMESTYDVSAGEGNNKRITVTYDRIAMSLKNPMMSMSYDSKDPAKSDPKLAMMSGMLNKPFSMEVTDHGEIRKIEGLGDIINGMGDTTTLEGMEMRRQMGQTFNDTAIRSMMQQSLNVFPDHPVKPGDTWKKSYSMNMGIMNMSIDNQFKLTSVTGNTAHVEMNATIKGGGTTAPEMKSMNINLSGDQKGTMDVEIATGLVTESKVKQNIKGDISAMGMKIPMTIAADIHLSAKKK